MTHKAKTISLEQDQWDALDTLKMEHGSYRDVIAFLLAPVGVAPVGQNTPTAPTGGKKLSKAARAKQELAASDLTAQAVGRDDIEYGTDTELPQGEHVTRITKPAVPATGRLAAWRSGRRPLLKPKDRK